MGPWCIGPCHDRLCELQPTLTMSLDLSIEQSRGKIAEAATAMLEGKMSFIEGARRICGLRFKAELSNSDPDIVPFVAIDSETDALPLGDVRQLWAPDALAKLQPEIDKAESWARSVGHSPSQNLAARFTAPQSNIIP